MIYTDGIHIISNASIVELHDWATRNEIGRHFYHRGKWPHYDIPKKRRDEKFPARYVTTREILAALKAVEHE